MNSNKSLLLCAVLAALTLPENAATIYYTDLTYTGMQSAIKRVNPDGSGMTTVVTGIQGPRGMTLDVPGRKMYWTELGLSAIRRANLDGTEVETVINTVLLRQGCVTAQRGGR